MNRKYINHINQVLHTLGNDYTNLYKDNFMKLLNAEIELLEKINPKLELKERRYNTLLCSSLRVSEYNQIPSLLNNLITDILKEVIL